MKRILTTLKEKWPEYLLEILVLIIGIYGAFALESWNSTKQDRIIEKELMDVMVHELESDSLQLSRMLETIEGKADQANELINYLFLPISEIDTAQLLTEIYLIGRFIQYNPSLPTFDEIVSSGQSTLIRSRVFKDEIKNYLKITNFHESFLYEEGRESKVLYNRHVRKYFDYRIFADYWAGGELDLIRAKSNLGQAPLLIDFEGFKADPESLYFTRQAAGTDEELQAILKIVKDNFLSTTLKKLREEVKRLEWNASWSPWKKNVWNADYTDDWINADFDIFQETNSQIC